ncbi:MAG TPA: VIT domain-containing protein [Gemmatimonadaceae bacterium]|nr:VIT domain-containing protein [Gemmatimonadaceae bacterium]
MRQSSDVRADLTDRVLRYEVTETFVNRGSRVGEADYIFPLPKGAAFQDLKLSINGEMVAGETMSADRARGIYEQIVRQQRDPALVEWMGYGMLRARIFPIAPGEVKKVVVRFQMVAEREGDALRIDYAKGREAPSGVAMLADTREADLPRGSFTLTYPNDVTFGSAYSPTHSLVTIRRGDRREVRVTGSSSEITLLVPVRRSSEPSISVLAYAPRDEDGFALITLSPPAVAPDVTPRDVTLVLDVSGSMSGVKIQQARAAGKQVLATLSPSDRFRLIDFSTDVRTFRDGFVRATRENVDAGSRYLESLEASGSTNISGALDAALQDGASSGRLGLVLFVTDGEPTIGERNPDAIASRVSRLRGDRRIFSFGVGADLNAALVERLAVEGKGTAQFVRPDESVERAVSIVASRLTNPLVTDMRVYADGVRLTKRLPSESSDIFAGQDFVLLTRYSGSGATQLRFEGRTSRGPVSWTSRVAFPSSTRENSFVARLWATQRIGYLSAEKRKNGGAREIDDEIRDLGERYAIPTEFTSYLVVEPGMSTSQPAFRVLSAPVRRDADFSGKGVRGGAASGVANAPAPVAQNAKVFEEAREASRQRAATSLAVADEIDLAKSNADSQRVGSKVFLKRGDAWVDAAKSDTARTVRIKPFSDAYFKLIDAIPELREVFALGDKVTVGTKAVTIQLTDDGSATISDSDLRTIQLSW